MRSTSSEPSPSKREVMHAYAERQRALMRQQRLEHRRRNAPLGAGCKGEHAAHAGLMRPCAAKHAVARPPPARSNGCTSANGCTAVSAMPSARALVAHAPRAAPSSRPRHASSSSAAAPSGLADDAQLGYDDFCELVRTLEPSRAFTDEQLTKRFDELQPVGGKVNAQDLRLTLLFETLSRKSARVIDLFRSWDTDGSASVHVSSSASPSPFHPPS